MRNWRDNMENMTEINRGNGVEGRTVTESHGNHNARYQKTFNVIYYASETVNERICVTLNETLSATI